MTWTHHLLWTHQWPIGPICAQNVQWHVGHVVRTAAVRESGRRRRPSFLCWHFCLRWDIWSVSNCVGPLWIETCPHLLSLFPKIQCWLHFFRLYLSHRWTFSSTDHLDFCVLLQVQCGKTMYNKSGHSVLSCEIPDVLAPSHGKQGALNVSVYLPLISLTSCASSPIQ